MAVEKKTRKTILCTVIMGTYYQYYESTKNEWDILSLRSLFAELNIIGYTNDKNF